MKIVIDIQMYEGASMTEWCHLLRVKSYLPLTVVSLSPARDIDLESLAPDHCGFECHQRLWILSCKKAIQLAYRLSVFLPRFPHAPEIMHRQVPT